MKVRWTKNSLRLRITPSEMAALLRGETVREEMRLPGGGASTGWGVEITTGDAGESGLLPFGLSGVRLSLTDADL